MVGARRAWREIKSALSWWGPTGNEGRAACVPSDELIGRLCGLGSQPDAGVPPYLGDRTFGSIRVALVEPTAPGGRAGISLGPAPPLGRAHVHTTLAH